MNTSQVTIQCSLCQGTHTVPANEAQLKGTEPIILLCDRLDRRYRLSGFYVEARRNIFRADSKMPIIVQDSQRKHLMMQFGELDFDAKFARWLQIKYPPLGLIEEYPEKISEIVQAFACGLYYPSVVACCCLAERVLNRLLLGTRDYFKSHPLYKKVYGKQSFDHWPSMIDTLLTWGVITSTAATEFRAMISVRNETIHYNDGYDFAAVAGPTLDHCIAAITEVFGVINRKDIYLVFDVPGEVWVRREAEEQPFVKVFVVPHCYRAYAAHVVNEAERRIEEYPGPIGPLTDAEFVKVRVQFEEERTRSLTRASSTSNPKGTPSE